MDREAIFRKLRLDVSDQLLIVNTPDEYLALLEDAEFDSLPVESRMGTYGFVQVFASSQAEMELRLKGAAGAGKYDCPFWACYPKSIGKQKYDLNRESVWAALGLSGLRAVSQIAISEKWSAMRGRAPELVGKQAINELVQRSKF